MEPKPFLIQPESLTLPGANSTVRSAAKTDYSVVNCSNSQKSSCPKNWSPKKTKPMSARRVNYSRPSKNAATKSTNSRLNTKPLPSISRSKICLTEIASNGCIQRKNTSSTRSSSSLIGLKQPSRSLPREKLKRLDDARSLIRQLFRTEVDLIPDQQNKALTVRLHPLITQAHDEVVRHLCEELTSTETVFPDTDLRLIYEISGSC